jgi:hypothetical protein
MNPRDNFRTGGGPAHLGLHRTAVDLLPIGWSAMPPQERVTPEPKGAEVRAKEPTAVVHTRAGVESVLVRGFLLVRTFDLLQALVAVATGGLARSTNATLDAGLLTVTVAETALLGRWLTKRRSVWPSAWPVLADIGLALMILGLSVAYVAPEARVSVWTMWAYPLTLSTTALIGASFSNWRLVLAGSTVLALTYLAVVATPLIHNSDGRATAIANAFAYPGFALVVFIFSDFVRKLANAADQARQRVTVLERERSRAITHDLLPFLRLEHFASADEATRIVLLQQAQEKYRQMRAFVDGVDDPRDLGARLREIVDLHPQLTARTVFDIESRVRLTPEVLEHLLRAVDTALSNVDQNALDAAIVVAVTTGPDTVTVTIHDDGPGFDPTNVTLGFGITQILGQQLEDIGGTGTVTSAPGKGTEVTIVLPKGGV